MTRRSLLKRVVLAVALGVATTVAVAWSLAVWPRWNNPRVGYGMLAPRGSPVSSVSVAQYWQRGHLLRSVTAGEEQPSNISWNPPASSVEVEVLTDAQVDAGWGAAHRALKRGQELAMVEDARGWPFLCLFSWKDFANGSTGGTFLRIRGEDPWGDDATVLPTLPIWRGFVLNTICFAAVWVLPLTLPMLLIARRRVRRGNCPACNYDLGNNLAAGCPECGWRRSTEMTNNRP